MHSILRELLCDLELDLDRETTERSDSRITNVRRCCLRPPTGNSTCGPPSLRSADRDRRYSSCSTSPSSAAINTVAIQQELKSIGARPLATREGGEGIRSVADLKGRTVGVQSLESPPHVFLSAMTTLVGLDPAKDIEWVTSAKVKPIQLFADGKIDAFLGFPPEPQRLRAQNIGRVIVNSAQDRLWLQYFCCMLAGNRELVRRNPVATKRVVRAMLRATDLCVSEPTVVAKRMVDGVSRLVWTTRSRPLRTCRTIGGASTILRTLSAFMHFVVELSKEIKEKAESWCVAFVEVAGAESDQPDRGQKAGERSDPEIVSEALVQTVGLPVLLADLLDRQAASGRTSNGRRPRNIRNRAGGSPSPWSLGSRSRPRHRCGSEGFRAGPRR